MITIEHRYCTPVEILYRPSTTDGSYGLYEYTTGNMDEIAEHICEVLVKHNLSAADVCSEETGEILMVIKRS